jgi:uncharacterized protein (TIGR02145 family)
LKIINDSFKIKIPTMKKVKSLSLLLLTVSLFYGCKKDEPAKIAVLSTTPVTNITVTTATSGGTISSDGGASITARGVCWSSSVDPSTSDSKTSDNNGIGQFVSNISDLSAGTTYHVRAYAINSVGTAYGEDITFLTLGQSPVATTMAATNISATGATLNGTVNANDLSTTVTFEYGSSTSYGQTSGATPGPVTGNTSTNVSAGITSLTPGATYHFRIKAVNSLGTIYGSDLVFSTQGLAPTATTQAATNLSSSSATLNGTVNANGLSTTISFEYGTTISYGQTAVATPGQITGNSITSANAARTGLTQGTTYHFRIKAVNSAGTSYGSDLTFTTTNTGTQIIDIDGNVYTTITIGTQIWLKENLKTTKYNDGTAIPNVTDNTAWSTLTSGAYSDYSNTPTYSTTYGYGRLYNWYAVASTNTKNVCPTGWHVPTDGQLTTLRTYLGGEALAGGKMKETGTTHWLTPNTSATNETGFTALPGGYRSSSGTFGLLGNTGYWWSSTEQNTNYGWYYYIYYGNGNFTRLDHEKHYGSSVRCLKD